MKKAFLWIITMVIVILPVFGQADFSGSADVSIFAYLPEPDNSSAILTRGVLGIEDISMKPSLVVKMDAEDEKTTFSAWFSMKEYPVGLALLAAASEDPVQEGRVTGLVSTTGDSIYSIDLMRLSANVYLTDDISMEIGRQSMLTGYGYGWNPVDFADPLKNPADPDADLRGVDAVVIRSNIGSSVSLKIYTLLPRGMLKSGLDYEEIKAGAESVFNFSGLEFRLSGFWDYDSTEGSDAYTPAAGAALMLDLFGVGVYGEAAARKGSRNYFTDGISLISRKTDWLFSGLAGLEYTFESGLYALIEYFYNGEGYNKLERSSFKDTLQGFMVAYGAPSADLVTAYTPGYFAKQYVLLNLMQPFYDINTNVNLSALYSPDSGALSLMPSVEYPFSGNFVIKLSYTGMFDFGDNDFNEVTALPVRHMVSTVFTYSF